MTIKIEVVRLLSSNSRLVDFAAFILANHEEDGLPDYAKLDILQIPRLVPHVFVYDVLGSTDNLRIKYCGTKVDEFYGTNMSGKCPCDYYKGEGTFDEVENMYWECIRTKTPSYTRRGVRLENDRVDKFKIVETILFPCSSDEGVVNYTIGFADFYNTEEPVEKCFTLIR